MNKLTNKPLIKIYPTDRNNKGDKKTAKLMEKIVNKNYQKYEGIIRSIVAVRSLIELVYAIQTDDKIWDGILEEVIKHDIKNKLYES